MNYITPYDFLRNAVMTRIRPSNIHGVGVFAIRNIKKGENVFPYWEGRTGIYDISKSEFESFSDELQDFIKAMRGYPYKVKLFNGCAYGFTNHYINTQFENGTVDCITYKALTDISINDELFSNYGKNYKHEYKLI
jgi:SET domain-containing protein